MNNSEQNFEFICYSKTRFILIILIGIVLTFPIAFFSIKYGLFGKLLIGIWIVLSGALVLFILPKHIAKAKLGLTINGDEFHLFWINTFFGCKNKQNIQFKIGDIKSYKCESTNNFSTFKLTFTSGKKFVFHQWYNDCEDDFRKFLSNFERIVKQFNGRKSTINPIIQAKSIMENKSFLLITGIIIGLIIIIGGYFIITKGMSNKTGIIYIIVVLSSFIWLIRQIIMGLRKKE